MSDWQYRYRPVDIGSSVTITEHQPGHKIALAVTEIQDRVIVDAEITLGDVLKIEVVDNVLKIVVPEYPEDPGGGGDPLPEGGDQYQVLQRDSQGQAVWDWVRTHE